MSKRPVHEIRYGLIKVSIWRNQTKSGERHSVSAVRLFKDGDSWRESTRFGRDDLLTASKALSDAHSWIYHQNENSTGSTDS
ncbi:MAG: hypothetical protein DWQ34_27230 [Planctomycetota bacterium]|nr:MAG: hypothetical protein DWQ34_27230 [Planctomycetota bacterium]REK28063.1 MAG: hypothetical protein DWQ41_06525 [Planctomycetota bacterium]REK37590.1 MAG: hypothetical protein DWQ45_06210 [Planctomycetota bacterium]